MHTENCAEIVHIKNSASVIQVLAGRTYVWQITARLFRTNTENAAEKLPIKRPAQLQ